MKMSKRTQQISPEKIKEIHLKKHGMQISKTLLDLHESYNELESDPGLWELLIRDLAGPDKVDVNEVLEMDKDLRSQVGEGEIHGVILLYLVKEDRNQRRYNKELESKFEKDERIVNGMFFPLQKIPNACATYAALSILLNSPSLALGDLLQRFKTFTNGMSPEAKGFAVGNSAEIAAYHNRRAPVAPSYAASVNSPKPQPSRTGVSYVIQQSQQFHFVPYVPINGVLMELDGLREYPISHGPILPGEDWTEKCRKVIGERMQKATGLNYTLLAVKTCHRTKCIEDTVIIQAKLNESFRTIVENKMILQDLKCALPEELVSFLQTFQSRTPLPSSPQEVPIDLPSNSEDMLPFCQFMIDLFQKTLEKNSRTLKVAEEKLTESQVEDKDALIVEVTSSETSPSSSLRSSSRWSDSPSQMAAPTPVSDVDSALESRGSQLKSESNESPSPEVIQYAAGYSLRVRRQSSSSSLLSGLTTAKSAGLLSPSESPSRKTAWPLNEVVSVDVKVEVLEESKRRSVQHACRSKIGRFVSLSGSATCTPVSVKRKMVAVTSRNSRSKSRKQSGRTLIGDVVIHQSPSGSLSREASILSSMTLDGATGSPAGVVTRRASRSASFSNPHQLTYSKFSSQSSSKQIKMESLEGSKPISTAPKLSLQAVKMEDGRWIQAAQITSAAKDLEEKKRAVSRLKQERLALERILAAIVAMEELEQERVKLYGKIVEENWKRSVIENDAEEREFDHDSYITVFLQRMFQLNLLTPEEIEIILPRDVVKKLEGSPDSDTGQRATALKRPNKRPSDGATGKSKSRKVRN